MKEVQETGVKENVGRMQGFNIHTLRPDMPVAFMCTGKQEKGMEGKEGERGEI